MKKEKLEYLSHLTIVLLGAALFAVLFLKYVLAAVLPFILAWLAAVASDRPATRLSQRTRVPKRILRIVISAIVTAGTVILTVLVSRLVLGQLWSLLTGLAEGGELSSIVNSLSEQILGIFGRMRLSEEVQSGLSDAASGMIGRVLTWLGSVITSVASAVPGILLFLVITVIAVVYFAWDLDGITAAVSSIMPPRAGEIISSVKHGALSVAGKYIRSYSLLLVITFAQMLIGFMIMGVRYAFLFALIIALLDLLPVIGVGTALVPASVFCFLSGREELGLGLLLLFAVSSVIRQLIEPKILGRHLGVHPLATLASMYIGYSFFGFAGILLLPIFIIAVGIYKNYSAKVAQSATAK